MSFLNLGSSNYARKKLFGIFFCFILISCETKYDRHVHQSISQSLVDCTNIISGSLKINPDNGESMPSIDKKFQFNSQVSPESVLRTLCAAKVERVIKTRSSALGKYKLKEDFTAKLRLNYADAQSIDLYFGRTTPDGFGQYVKVTSLPVFSSLFYPTTEILIVPAYHLKLLISTMIEFNFNK